MINILIDSNDFHIKNHKVSSKFRTLTNIMKQVKTTLLSVHIRLNKNFEIEFWSHDFNYPIFNEKFKPVMP